MPPKHAVAVVAECVGAVRGSFSATQQPAPDGLKKWEAPDISSQKDSPLARGMKILHNERITKAAQA